MADILVELLAEQPVLQFQRSDTRTQLIYRLKQRGVGVHQLALTDTRRIEKFHWSERFMEKLFSMSSNADTSSFLTALPAHESTH